ncbi:transposase [Streptomyces platensis]|nr:transposase [Streptomyces platensis]WUB84450.1 transposase [Streptomyces platensis]
MPAAARRRRYPSDTTAAEWALIEPLLPVPACETKRGGHPEKWPRRQIVDAIRYIVDNGAKWRALPADFCEMLWRLRLTHPQITQVWADSAYAGQLVTWADDFLRLTLKTVSRPRGAKGFVVLPRRWRVERTLGWIMRVRRNVRDYERLPQHSESHLTWALITVMTRRLTRKGAARGWTQRPTP